MRMQVSSNATMTDVMTGKTVTGQLTNSFGYCAAPHVSHRGDVGSAGILPIFDHSASHSIEYLGPFRADAGRRGQ